jgi:outer membrane protein OmpA-like peptidoglycan-associated protein
VAAAFPLPDVGGLPPQAPAGSEPASGQGGRNVTLPLQTERLERELLGLGLTAQRLADGAWYVNLRREVPFDRNSSEVKPESRAFLDQLAELLRRQEGLVFAVVGRTDDSGTREHNALLARRRAEAVASHLRLQGVSADVLRAEGQRDPDGAQPAMGTPPADLRRIDLYITRNLSADRRTAARP